MTASASHSSGVAGTTSTFCGGKRPTEREPAVTSGTANARSASPATNACRSYFFPLIFRPDALGAPADFAGACPAVSVGARVGDVGFAAVDATIGSPAHGSASSHFSRSVSLFAARWHVTNWSRAAASQPRRARSIHILAR